ncbi:MAG: hypothetical protein ACFE8G_04840 [Candidatus Hermodarchaeota archaeon]
MSLKCPICGKEYYYESKICQICENESINCGLISNDENRPQRWNCGIFLEFDTLTFGTKKPSKEYIKLASEPKFYNFKPREDYVWNCNSRFRSKNFLTLKSIISQFSRFENPPTKDSTILEKENGRLLIYE